MLNLPPHTQKPWTFILHQIGPNTNYPSLRSRKWSKLWAVVIKSPTATLLHSNLPSSPRAPPLSNIVGVKCPICLLTENGPLLFNIILLAQMGLCQPIVYCE